MASDAWLVLAAKGVRTFGYGFLGVLYPIYLIRLGLDATGLGVAVTLTLVASAVLTAAVRRPAERYGPRTVLVALAGLGVVSAVLFIVAQAPWVVVVAAMVGNLAVGSGETGPFLALEQVLVARTAARDRLTTVLSFYNLVGYVAAALGAAVVGGARPDLLFSVFLLGSLIQVGLYALMSSRRPGPAPAPRSAAAASPSRPLVRRVAALFALDSLAGGFVLQSLVTYWFYTRFGLSVGTLGWIFFGAQLLSGVSLLLAARIAPRLGLVNTMVFSHLISNGFLLLLPAAPSALVAVLLLLARHLLSQMDVPTRQAFLMLVVADHEREHAASLTGLSRTVAQAVSPALTGWIMQTVSLSAPFLLGGGLKIVYDLLLYQTIRRITPKEA